MRGSSRGRQICVGTIQVDGESLLLPLQLNLLPVLSSQPPQESEEIHENSLQIMNLKQYEAQSARAESTHNTCVM